MRIFIKIVFLFTISYTTFSQENKVKIDTIIIRKDTIKLEEIVVVSRRKLSNQRQEKTLSTIDNYLEKSNKVTMIKRGNYAWEPTINNMVSDRLVVTIDGMQIFGACTDKMDPITSYVDVSNLEKVTIGSGQEGTENGHCVGGGIDLKLPTSKFNNKGLQSSVDLGYETNGNYRATGIDLEYYSNSFYINADGLFRKSGNYKAGGNQEVLFSQFQKYNLSLQSGYKLSENHSLDGNIIYDKATDVGYPALPMDVSLAEALITSFSHNYTLESKMLQTLETKVYFNTITHIMDDSKRPDVPIRMDMPGWSETGGFYSKAELLIKNHFLTLNINGFFNKSLAEMTMFSNNPNEPNMFMYTWPDIRTQYLGFFIKDEFYFKNNQTLTSTLRLGYHNNRIAKIEGVQSLSIFHTNVEEQRDRLLLSFSTNYKIKDYNRTTSFGLGYGERAPSVSEGYGFFLFNSFDNYDYIGNPNLENEKALEFNFSFKNKLKNFSYSLESSFFYIMDYIIGDIATNVPPMTIGANGVRVYEALDNATIFNTYLNATYNFSKSFSINGTFGYNYGKGSNDKNLPLIRPVSYVLELNYQKKRFNAALQIEGNATQHNFGGFYGENKTPSFTVINLNFGNLFIHKKGKTILKYGIDNLLDLNYSTFADWNNIPRQGRNIYLNISKVF